MTMRARVERNSTTTSDDYNQPGEPIWQPHLDALPCWLYSQVEREVLDTAKVAVVEDLRMMVPRGTDLTEKDRINGVVDRRGNTVRAGLLLIEAIVSRRSHVELAVRGIAA